MLRLSGLNVKHCLNNGRHYLLLSKVRFQFGNTTHVFSTIATQPQQQIPSYEVNTNFQITPFIIQYPDIYQIKRERFGRALERFKQLYEAPIIDAFYQYMKEKEKAERARKNSEKKEVRRILKKIRGLKKVLGTLSYNTIIRLFFSQFFSSFL
jgi:hypothetical protein